MNTEQAEEPKKQTSTMMEEPTFDAKTKTLTITFKKGGTYTYPGFPEDKFNEFIAAPSWGKWYHQHKELFANGILKRVSEDEQLAS